MIKTNQPQEGIYIIRPEGRLDAMAVPEFDDTTAKLISAETKGLIFDLEITSFVDSSGLSSIIKLYKAVHQHKIPVAFCRIPPPVMSLFKLTKVNTVFNICDSLAEATAKVAPKR